MELSIFNVVLFMLLFYTRFCVPQKWNSPFTIWDTTLPIPLGIFGISTYKDELTIVNGKNGAINNLLSYSISLTSTYHGWSNNTFSVFNSNEILIGVSVEVNDKIYVINPSVGGECTVTAGQAMLIYDLTLKQYLDTSTYASSPPLRAHYPCVVYNYNNNLIYVMGGQYNGERKNYTQTYDITSDLWGSVSNINVARTYAACDMDVSAQYIYLFGGVTNAEEYGSMSIEEYDVSSDTWTVLSTTLMDPSREFDCTLLPSDGKIYCFGGRYYGSYMNSVQQFDPTDYSINKLTMKIPRQYGRSITWRNDCLLIVGGNTGSNGIIGAYTDTIEYYGNCTFTTHSTTISQNIISTKVSSDTMKVQPEGVFITTQYIIIIILTVICMALCCIIVGFIIGCYCIFYRKRLREAKKQQTTNSIAMNTRGLPTLPRITSPTLPELPKDDISDGEEPIPNEININNQQNDDITLGDSMYQKSAEGKMTLSNYKSNSEALYVHHGTPETNLKGKLCDNPSVSLIQANDTIDESVCVNV